MADIQKLVEELSKLTVLEAVELSKALEETWGVSAAAAVAVAAGPVAAAAEEKTEFDVVLADTGANKLAVIKAVKETLGADKLVTVTDYEEPTEYFHDVEAMGGIEVGEACASGLPVDVEPGPVFQCGLYFCPFQVVVHAMDVFLAAVVNDGSV